MPVMSSEQIESAIAEARRCRAFALRQARQVTGAAARRNLVGRARAWHSTVMTYRRAQRIAECTGEPVEMRGFRVECRTGKTWAAVYVMAVSDIAALARVRLSFGGDPRRFRLPAPERRSIRRGAANEPRGR